jgi:large repetitive protein
MNSAFSTARLICICFVIALLAPLTFAQSPASSPRITSAIDESIRTTLPGTTPKAIKAAQDMGAVEDGHSLQRMMLVLQPGSDQQIALSHLIQSQNNKSSAQYHKWLTPAQFAAQFGPTDDDLEKVTGWLQAWGMTVTQVSKGRQWVEFSGTAQQVNSAFRVTLHQYEQNGQKHIANSSDISIPAALSPVVAGVLSLNNFEKTPQHTAVTKVKRNSQGKLAPVNPNTTTTDGNGNWYYYLAPSDFQTIYDETPLMKSSVTGSGISLAIAGRSDINLSDVQSFRQIFGLPQNDPNIILNGTDPGYPNYGSDQTESTLDVEWAGASAPGATINLVESASTDTTDGIDLSSAYIVDNDIAPIMSLSYGGCEELMGPTENEFYNSLWQQAAAEGITVFVSTGDGGAASCDSELQQDGYIPQGPAYFGPTVNGLASTPYNVAVGGTQLNEAGNYSTYWSPNNNAGFGSANGYIPEQAWNESCDPTMPQSSTNCAYGQTYYVLEGGGGGPSSCSQETVNSQGDPTCIGGYAKPSWQTGTGVPNDGVRDLPDLSLNASPDDEGYLFCVNAGCETTLVNGQTTLQQAGIVGGTSVSTPAMAGIMALVEQKYGAFQGQANYVFYKLAALDQLSSCNSSAMTNPTQASACVFNDITAGNNSDPGLPGYGTSTAEWSAGVGYDMATGLGTVNAANLVADWNNASFAGSTTTLSTSATTLTHGQPLPIQIAVTAANGSSSSVPSGNVALVTNTYGSAGNVTLNASGQYSGSVSSLPGGSYNLTANYGGDGNFSSSASAPVSLTVSPEPSVVSFHFDVVNNNQQTPYTGTAQFGYPLYLNVTVAGKSGQGLPTGTVNILNGGKVVMSAPLTSSGTVTILTGSTAAYAFPVGNNSVTVQYSGDNSFQAGTSAPQTLSIQQQQVITYVGLSSGQVPVGQPVFLNAVIPPGNGSTVPTGTFQFYDNGQPLGSPIAVVNNGGYAQTTYTAQFTTAGTHLLSVGYSGDANFAPVSGTNPNAAYPSQLTVITPSGGATTTSITQTPTTVAFGQYFTYSVKVTPAKAGGPAPTGAVTIHANGGLGGSINLVNGQGSTTLLVNAGTYQVYAQYQGDANYASSESPVITTTITKYTPPTSLTTTAPYVLPGQQTSLNAVVTGFSYGQFGSLNPSGTLQFFTSVNGGAPQALTSAILLEALQPNINSGVSVRANLPTGTNVVTAQYSGDTNFNAVTLAPVTITVTPPDFTVSSSPSALTISSGGSTTDTLTVAPILGFSGAVSLSCASGLPAGTTCNFSPSALQSGSGQSSLAITMQGPFTTQTASAKPKANAKPKWEIPAELCGVVGLFLVGFPRRRRKALGMILVVLAAFGVMSGCSGSGGFSPSSSVVVLQSSQSKIASGTAVAFIAQISGEGSTPTGTITFYDGSTALGNAATLTNGQASVQVSNLSVGTHSITASYNGDASHLPSTSQPVYEAVTGTTTLQLIASSGSLSHAVNINLTVQ